MALLLAIFLEMPLRGLGWFASTRAILRSLQIEKEWTASITGLAGHPGVMKLLQDVIGSGCFTDDVSRDHLQSFAQILAKHAPPALVSSSSKKTDKPFTEKRKQALARGFEAGFAKMKLREGHAGEAHKKRAEAARAKRFGAGAGAGSGAGAGAGAGAGSGAGAGAAADDDEDDGAPGAASGVVTGLTAFLTADWDGEEGVYSDSEDGGDSDDAIVPIPAFADTIAVLKSLLPIRVYFPVFQSIGRLLAYWCLEGLPTLDLLRLSRDILSAYTLKPETESTLNDFLADCLREHARALKENPSSLLPVLVNNTVLNVAANHGSVLIPKGYKYIRREVQYFSFNRVLREDGLLPELAHVLERIGIEESTNREEFHTLPTRVIADSEEAMRKFVTSYDQFLQWTENNALVSLNDSLQVQDTWVPIELCFRIHGLFVPVSAETPQTDLKWRPSICTREVSGYHDYRIVSRPKYVPDALPPSMSVVEGLHSFFTHPVTASQVEQDIKEGKWRPFRSLDAGLNTVSVVTYAPGQVRDDAPSVEWTFQHDRKARRRTAEAMKDMIRVLTGFLKPWLKENVIAYTNDRMTERQQDSLVPLVIDLHRGTYERLISAASNPEDARLLATSLSPRSLWYLAAIVFSANQPPPQNPHAYHKSDYARHAAFVHDVKQAAGAILEAIPGPCFPVRLVLGRRTSWELRPRRRIHGQWFVEVPMALPVGYEGLPTDAVNSSKEEKWWEPLFLPSDFFIDYIDRNFFSDAVLSTALLARKFLRVGLWHIRDGDDQWKTSFNGFMGIVRHFLWYSAGLACVAPAAVVFLRETDVSLCARLQLLWSGTEDVDSNPVTYNNVLALLKVLPKLELPPIPPMLTCRAWMDAHRGQLQLPASGAGLREVPAFVPFYPALHKLPNRLNEDCKTFARMFGVPLDDYSRMDMDDAVSKAPDDVKEAALQLRAALLDGDVSNPRLVDEIDQMLGHVEVLSAAFCRINGVLPLQESVRATTRHPGIEYRHPIKRPRANAEAVFSFPQ